MSHFVTLNGPKLTSFMDEYDMRSHAGVDWSNFIREVLISWVEDKTVCKQLEIQVKF